MRKIIYILLFLVIFIGVGLYFYNSLNKLATYQSPDGKYELIIKDNTSFFELVMPGQGGLGSKSILVILKDSNGKIIGKSKSNSNCGIFYDSVEVEWDLKNEQVWYGRAKSINIKTGKVEC